MTMFPFIKKMAADWIANQVVREGDSYNDEGMLVCGVCNEPRQEMRPFPDPTEDDRDHETLLKVTRMCRCDREAEEERKKREQLEEDMKRIQYLRKVSLIDAKFADATFDSFTENSFNKKNRKLCLRYATAFDTMLAKNQGLLMWGNVGTGKSFAAACIANFLLEHKIPVCMTSFVRLLEIIDKNRDEEGTIISRLESAKLVIFDDLGAERSTDYALEKVYNIIDSRYRSMLPMIVTTNLTMEEMKNETDIRYSRIYDRVFEVCYPMQFTGNSWRRIAANQRYKDMEKFLMDED